MKDTELKEPCSKDNGEHYCLKCRLNLESKLEALRHVWMGHVIAWKCPEHGLERTLNA